MSLRSCASRTPWSLCNSRRLSTFSDAFALLLMFFLVFLREIVFFLVFLTNFAISYNLLLDESSFMSKIVGYKVYLRKILPQLRIYASKKFVKVKKI